METLYMLPEQMKQESNLAQEVLTGQEVINAQFQAIVDEIEQATSAEVREELEATAAHKGCSIIGDGGGWQVPDPPKPPQFDTK